MKNDRRGHESLWSAEDQARRLDELTIEEPEIKEIPLRRDVRSLGRLLGEVLKEQAGERLFDQVEELRLLTTQYRDAAAVEEAGGASKHPEQLMHAVTKAAADLNPAEAYALAKAFAIYFELTNLAETNHRKRRGR